MRKRTGKTALCMLAYVMLAWTVAANVYTWHGSGSTAHQTSGDGAKWERAENWTTGTEAYPDGVGHVAQRTGPDGGDTLLTFDTLTEITLGQFLWQGASTNIGGTLQKIIWNNNGELNEYGTAGALFQRTGIWRTFNVGAMPAFQLDDALTMRFANARENYVSGNITGPGKLTIVSAGGTNFVRLTGNNTYEGGTELVGDGGPPIQLNSTSALGTGDVQVTGDAEVWINANQVMDASAVLDVTDSENITLVLADGTNTIVSGLIIDGFEQAVGTWGSWETFDVDHNHAIFEGTGMLTVIAPADTPPDAPEWITYPEDSASGQFTVSWAASDGAAAYTLERSTDDGANWTEVETGTAVEYQENVGTGTYLYRVAAWNSQGYSDWTTGDHGIVVLIIPDPPDTPASITYPATSTTGRYTVSWPAAARAEEYLLERSDDGGLAWTGIYTGADASFNDTVEDGLYMYRVQAWNLGGNSDWQEGLVETLVTLTLQETWRREYFVDPWDEDVAGPMVDANDDGYANFMNYALRGDPLVNDGPVIEPRVVRDAGTGEPVFAFRVRDDNGMFSVETGGYYTDAGIAYYVETGEGPQAQQWARVPLTPANTEIVQEGDGPVMRVAIGPAFTGEPGGFARLIIRDIAEDSTSEPLAMDALFVDPGTYTWVGLGGKFDQAGNEIHRTYDDASNWLEVVVPDGPGVMIEGSGQLEWFVFALMTDLTLGGYTWTTGGSHGFDNTLQTLTWDNNGAGVLVDRTGTWRFSLNPQHMVLADDVTIRHNSTAGDAALWLYNAISGPGSLSLDLVTGYADLRGMNTYEGGTYILSGGEVRARASSLGAGDVVVGGAEDEWGMPIPMARAATIRFVESDVMGFSAALVITESTNTTVDLAADTNTFIRRLEIDGVDQDLGVWGSPGNMLADHHHAVFTGTGTLTVIEVDTPPEAPAGLLYPGDASTGEFAVSWQAADGALSYALERSDDGGASWSAVYSGPSLTYTDTVGFGAYLYRVRAVNPAGGSDWVTGDVVISGMAPPRPAGFIRMALQAGQWKLAGISFEQPDAALTGLADVLGTSGFANGTRAMVWDSGELKYKTADFFIDAWYGDAIALIRGQGFWIRAPEEGELFIPGQVSQAEETALPLTEGLQLFCPPYPVAMDMNDADVFTSEPIDGDRLTAFDGVSYSTADYFLGQWYGNVLLQPGQGYWYRSGGEQEMTVVKPYE